MKTDIAEGGNYLIKAALRLLNKSSPPFHFPWHLPIAARELMVIKLRV